MKGWSLHYDCEIFAKVCLILPQHDVDGGHEAGPLLVWDGEDAGVEAGAHQPHPGLHQPQRRHLVPRPRARERHSSQVPVNTAMAAEYRYRAISWPKLKIDNAFFRHFTSHFNFLNFLNTPKFCILDEFWLTNWQNTKWRQFCESPCIIDYDANRCKVTEWFLPMQSWYWPSQYFGRLNFCQASHD